jgi:hypothetical protein
MNAKRNRGIAARKAKVFHLHFESDLRGDRFASPPHHLPGLLRSFRVFFPLLFAALLLLERIAS